MRIAWKHTSAEHPARSVLRAPQSPLTERCPVSVAAISSPSLYFPVFCEKIPLTTVFLLEQLNSRRNRDDN